MKKQNDNEFTSADLYFSAYLQVRGLPLLRTVKEGSRVSFVFDTTPHETVPTFEELKSSWFNSTGLVPGQPYSHAVKSLKSLCMMGH